VECFITNLASTEKVSSSVQGCQFGFVEAKFVIFGLFSIPLDLFLFLKKGQMKFCFFWPFLANSIFYADLAGFMKILVDF